MKLLPKAKGLGEVISAALLSLLIKAAAFKELYKLLKHEAADKSSVQHSPRKFSLHKPHEST